MTGEVRTAIGLMSGTSMDGIDAAILRTDGGERVEPGPALTVPYPEDVRARLRALIEAPVRGTSAQAVEAEITALHADAVAKLLRDGGVDRSDVAVIGFHGHTVLHRPERRETWQIGDGAALAAATACAVVADFRTADVRAGGQGAPFAPLYHAALAAALPRPLAVLNLGGVGNVTWIGAGELLAFDTGPGNALLDDWVRRHGRGAFDEGGRLAAAGRADEARIAAALGAPHFRRPPPKSLDRGDFDLGFVSGLGPADGAATLAGLTVAAVCAALDHLPTAPKRWLVTGGGRHNPVLMDGLGAALGAPVDPVEAAGWRGDSLEAEAFAYLAVRSLRGLPLSLPSTTGVPAAMPGGVLFRAP